MNFNKLNHRVHFFGKHEADAFMPSTQSSQVELFSCYASVDNVFLKDIELAKSNNSLNDVTVIIRDTQGEFIPDNEMRFKIEGKNFGLKEYEVKSVQPFFKDGRYIAVIGSDIT